MTVRRLQALLNRQTAFLLALALIFVNLMLLSGGASALHTYPTFVAATSSGGSIPDGGTLTVLVPAGTQSGDLLLAHIGYNAASSSTITPSAGWTTVSVEDEGGSDIKQGIYWRIATSSEPPNYGFTLSSGQTDTAAGAIAAYRGVDPTAPIHTFASLDNGTALALDAPSVTTTLAGTTVVAFYSVRDLNQIDPAAAMTERWDVGSNAAVGDPNETRIAAAEEQWGAAGPTGIRTATAGASAGGVAHMVALAPPPTAPTFEVNSTRDDADTNPGDGLCNTGSLNTASEPECTLRAALEEANFTVAPDSITFNIPNSELGYRAVPQSWVITPDSPLPIALNPVSLDARTQPGWSGDPVIELDISNATGSVAGLVLWTDDSLIAGFAVHSSSDDGLEIDGTTANGDAGDRNVLRDNWVGLDATGAAVGNPDIGILVTDNADDNQLIDNVVGASGSEGIVVRIGSTRNVVTGNFVGVTADLATPIPNAGHGIHLHGGAFDNTIGGTFPTNANTVANNQLNGITIDADAGTGNAMLRNILYDNTLLGIDLGNDGPTANDPGDGDGPGPNNYINFPDIQSAVDRSGTVTVYYRLDAPAGDYRVEFFSNPSGGDLTGGESETFEGAHTIFGHPGGTLQYFASFPASAGAVITGTATLVEGTMFGSTSEFASNVVAIPADFRVNSTGDAPDNNLRDGVCNTGGPLIGGRPECTLRAAIQETDALNLADTITFDIPTADIGHVAGVWTISPASPLPTVNDEVTIDATTQPGYTASPVIRVDGASAGVASGFHLGVGSADSVLRGFMVTGFSVDGVVLTSGIGRMIVEDNWIGTDGTGAVGAGMGDDGVEINAPDAVIRNNVINNATDEGIDVLGTGADIYGNIIGLDPDGSSGSGNLDVGIALFADNTTIGGDTAAERNVISNNWEGIEVNSSNNVIQGNYIGTD
ncbi:MAG: hypothetical protein HKN91_10830, partial [Acidimicrobiia bacterium]|nr:hypothetical protein [Acidimicrobiia bacterium]